MFIPTCHTIEMKAQYVFQMQTDYSLRRNRTKENKSNFTYTEFC